MHGGAHRAALRVAAGLSLEGAERAAPRQALRRAFKAFSGIEGRVYGPEAVADLAARRELGKAQSEKANSVILHELYFSGMTAKAPDPTEDLRTALTKRSGSLDRWRADLEACALVANGWALLAAHPLNGRLYHVVSDAHDVGPLWFARPLVLVDMYEHAYYVDFKNDNAAYVKAWFEHIDWVEADRRWRATYPHKEAEGRCSFEALVTERCSNDPVLVEMARIVRGADFAEDVGIAPESAGLVAISRGFPLVAKDDLETLERASFLYDALYASLQPRRAKRGGS